MSIPINNAPKRVWAKFAVYSDNLAPAQISKILSIEFQRMIEKDDSGKYKRLTNACLISSKEHVESKLIADHIAYLLKLLLPHQKAIQTLVSDGCSAFLDCYVGIDHWNTVVDLTVEELQQLSLLKVPIRFDIYDEQSSSPN